MALIYLIDDNEGFNYLTEKVIEDLNENHQVEKFVDPDEAIEQILSLEKLPEYIFLDINMPSIDGWELLSILEEEIDNLHEKTNVIMLTSSILPADMDKAQTIESVKYYINKPLSEYYAKEILGSKD